MAKTAVLLVNLGTPDAPNTGDVRSYLTQFLNDPRVIDLPWLGRKLLVNAIIVPFRAAKSAREYKKVWTEEGSPLKFISEKLRDQVQEQIGEKAEVFLAMRYKHPALNEVLEEIRRKNFRKIIIIPLFPQYASASSGSVMELVMKQMAKWWAIPEVVLVNQFYDHPLMLEAYKEVGAKYDHTQYDHVLFSFHGLPIRHVDKVYADGLCTDRDCTHEITDENHLCYKATCYATARNIATSLGIPHDKYTVCFQSRLNKKWLEPFTDVVVSELGDQGKKKVLVFSPAFVADCLETIVEIGQEYQELFEEHGGEKVQLVESLNNNPAWVKLLGTLVEERL